MDGLALFAQDPHRIEAGDAQAWQQTRSQGDDDQQDRDAEIGHRITRAQVGNGRGDERRGRERQADAHQRADRGERDA
jgi:hypothetical protein